MLVLHLERLGRITLLSAFLMCGACSLKNQNEGANQHKSLYFDGQSFVAMPEALVSSSDAELDSAGVRGAESTNLLSSELSGALYDDINYVDSENVISELEERNKKRTYTIIDPVFGPQNVEAGLLEQTRSAFVSEPVRDFPSVDFFPLGVSKKVDSVFSLSNRHSTLKLSEVEFFINEVPVMAAVQIHGDSFLNCVDSSVIVIDSIARRAVLPLYFYRIKNDSVEALVNVEQLVVPETSTKYGKFRYRLPCLDVAGEDTVLLLAANLTEPTVVMSKRVVSLFSSDVNERSVKVKGEGMIEVYYE